MDTHFRWKKGQAITLSPFFSSTEFTCSCNSPRCVEQMIAKELIEKLNITRKRFKDPIYVTSGFRCAEKQAALRGAGMETAKGISQHELGNAADVTAPKIMELKAYLQMEFKAIGTAISFIHVDLRADKKREWGYKPIKGKR